MDVSAGDSGGSLRGQGMPGSRCCPERPVDLPAATHHLPVLFIKFYPNAKRQSAYLNLDM